MRFEYKVVRVPSLEIREDQFTALGNDGWELVNFQINNTSMVVAIFKKIRED